MQIMMAKMQVVMEPVGNLIQTKAQGKTDTDLTVTLTTSDKPYATSF